MKKEVTHMGRHIEALKNLSHVSKRDEERKNMSGKPTFLHRPQKKK